MKVFFSVSDNYIVKGSNTDSIISSRKIKIFQVFAFFLLTIPMTCIAQNNILDTLQLGNKKIIIWSNKTWSYLTDENGPLKETAVVEVKYNEFPDHWETNSLYAYLSERNSPCEDFVLDLKTIDKNNFTMPVIGRLYRGFKSGHTGLDIELKTWDTVVCAFDGIVRYAGYHKNGYGNAVAVRHSNQMETWYTHLSKNLVTPNQVVKSGQIIGLGGMTGRATAPHLHFEARYKDVPFNAEFFIDLATHSIKKDLQVINVCLHKNKKTVIEKDTAKKPQEILLKDTISGINKESNNNPNVLNKKGNINETALYKKKTYNSGNQSKNKYHIIKKGDTLYKIAKQHSTTVKKICEANGMSEHETLKLDKKIIIP